MRWLLFVAALALLFAACAGPQYPQVCRNVPGEDFVAVECVDFGFSEDRSSVFVRLDRPVLTASFSTQEGLGKCSVSGESLIRCPVAAEEDGVTFFEVAGAVRSGEEAPEFALEIQVS